MLLHRFDCQVVPSSTDIGKPKEIDLVISFYRKNVDNAYQQMVVDRIEKGDLDQYVKMLLCNIVASGNRLFSYWQLGTSSRDLLFVDACNMAYVQAYQTEVRTFEVEAVDEPVWAFGLELLGRPQMARLTTFAKKHYMDVYYQ